MNRRKLMSSRGLSHRRRTTIEMLEVRQVLSGDPIGDSLLGDEAAFTQFESDEAFDAYLTELAVRQHQHLFDQPGGWWYYPEVDVAFGGPEAGDDGRFSDTNVQIEGIDEADIVETNGEFLYILSDNELSVVDVSQPASPHVTWHHTFEEGHWPQGLYLHEDRLSVISGQGGYYYGGPELVDPAIDLAVDAIYPPYPVSPPTVRTTTFDLHEAGQPSLLQTTEVDGWLVNSRSIDGTIYLVVQDSIDLPLPRLLDVEPSDPVTDDPTGDADADALFAPDIWYPNDEITQVYESEASYRAWLTETGFDVLPEFTRYGASGDQLTSGDLVAPTDILVEEGELYPQFLSVVTLDTGSLDTAPQETTTVITQASGELFMSHDAIYLFRGKWQADGVSTNILKFDVDTATGVVTPAARGSVPGTVLNRFSADEHDGFLRIATTEGWGVDATNYISVLGQTGTSLEIVGQTDVAPGETIFSARFLGDEGYVVTFLRTDPLFRLDLSDPTAPTVVGELEIPGFSDYLQPMGSEHLLGLGRDADPETGIATALQVSLFDVGADQPALVDRYHFPGGQGSWTNATWDPHAFGFYPEYGVLALPVSSYYSETPWGRSAYPTYALFVLSVDPTDGIALAHTVEHASPVLRSVRIDDNLFSISSHTIEVVSLGSDATALSSIDYRDGGPVLLRDIDQHGDTPDTATRVELWNGGAIEMISRLEEGGDVDVFAISPSSAGALALDAKFSSDSELQVTITDAAGDEVAHHVFAAGDGLLLETDARTDWFVAVSSVDGEATGDYAVSFHWRADPLADDHADEIGPDATYVDFSDHFAELFGVLGTVDDRDVFVTDIEADGRIFLEDGGFPGIALTVEVVSGDTVTHYESIPGEVPHELAVQEGDRVYLVVHWQGVPEDVLIPNEYFLLAHFEPGDGGNGGGGGQGEDDHVDHFGPDATPIGPGPAELFGVLSDAEDRDVFQLEVTADSTVRIDALIFVDTGLQLFRYDANGELLDAWRADETAPELEFRMSQGEMQYLVVDGNATGGPIDYFAHVDVQPISTDGGGNSRDPVTSSDLNGDGSIDSFDAGLMFANWGMQVTPAADGLASEATPFGDLNGDGMIDAADAAILFAAWTDLPDDTADDAVDALFDE